MTDNGSLTETDGERPGSASSTYAELHMASAFSFLRGASLPETLVARAGALGMPALALTDYMSLAGVVRFQAACARHGIQPIVGVELAVADPVFGAPARPAQLVALAEDPTGYARLCRLLTDANLARPEAPVLHWRDLADEPEGLILLTGGREGTLVRLVLAGKRHAAREVVRRYRDAFGPSRVYVEVQHQRLPGNHSLLCQLAELAEEAGLRCVATNGVQHALRQDRIIYDLMTCTRLGITVDRPHAERPRNDEACLKSATEMATLFAECSWGSAALAITSEIANRCQLSLLKGTCTAPHVPLPAGKTPKSYLHALCEEGLTTRYASRPDARRAGSAERTQLEHELAVIARLQLEEFFLCVDQRNNCKCKPRQMVNSVPKMQLISAINARGLYDTPLCRASPPTGRIMEGSISRVGKPAY